MFDFRKYNPYQGNLQRSGVYVFKTNDKDSSPYTHKLTGIEVFQCTLLQQLILTYKSTIEPHTIVKILLPHNADELEFEIFFSRLDLTLYKQGGGGIDVTVNWRSNEIDNKGIFYTDANAFKFMRRDINKDLSRTYLTPINK